MIVLVVKLKMASLSVIKKFDLCQFGLAVPRVEVKAQVKGVMQILKTWVFDLCHI